MSYKSISNIKAAIWYQANKLNRMSLMKSSCKDGYYGKANYLQPLFSL